MGMSRVALVSLGGAGTSIMREIIKISKSDIDLYNVNTKEILEGAKFFGYEELEILADELRSYECVVMTGGLGSTGGDALVKLYGMLDSVRKICFVVSPFYFEIERLMRSRSQIGYLVNENFEGAVVSLNTILDRGLELDKKKLEKAIVRFDREMATMILDMIPELE